MFHKPDPDLKLRFLWLAIGYALVMLVVYLSVTSQPIDTGLEFPFMDKAYHALAYFTLMFWFGQIYHDRFQRNMVAVVFIIMGMSMEYVQSFDPHRTAEFADIIANGAGVMTGLLLVVGRAKNILLGIESRLP